MRRGSPFLLLDQGWAPRVETIEDAAAVMRSGLIWEASGCI
jgi:hypothetical protein